MAKLKKNKFSTFRFGTIGFMISICAVLGISIGISNAQIWTEPTFTPPSGNIPAPIWNQNAADQSANFRISGTGTFGTRAGIGVASPSGRFQVALTKTNSGTIIDEVGDFADYLTVSTSAATANGDKIPLVFNVGGQTGPHISSVIEAGREASGWNTYLAFYTNNLTSGAQGTDAIQEKMRLNSAGYLGIGTSTPGYTLDVNGTINALGGAGSGLLATSTGAYGIYGVGNTAGIGGVSTTGYGVYGSSSGSYAGYFAGTLNATGEITQNGVAVCLADGTNCGSGSSSLPIVSTVGALINTSSLATKDALCVSEYGSSYQAASSSSVALNFSGNQASYGYRNPSGSGVSGQVNIFALTSEPSTSIRSMNTTYRLDKYYYAYATNQHTVPVFCEKKTNSIIFTRSSIINTSSLVTKNALCVSEYGASYRTALASEVIMNFKARPMHYSYVDASGSGLSGQDWRVGLVAETNTFIMSSINYVEEYRDDYPTSPPSAIVACIKVN